jgi:hypothetical protein
MGVHRLSLDHLHPKRSRGVARGSNLDGVLPGIHWNDPIRPSTLEVSGGLAIHDDYCLLGSWFG